MKEKSFEKAFRSRKIVFINQATGYLTIDIINEFVKEFEEVALITGSIRVQDTPLDPKVKISPIIKYNRGNNFRKAFSWAMGTFQVYFLLRSKYKNYEKFFFTIPPTAYLLSLSFKSSFSIAVYDLYPEALLANGFKEKGALFQWWIRKNRRIFPKAHRIYTLSENMKSQIQAYTPTADVRMISNWSSFSGYTPIKKDLNSIIKREGLTGKFIVQYSGNIGVTHNVETLVVVADMLKDHKDIEFLIIGRGDRSHAIGELINSKKLTNCKLLPFRRDEELFESLCVADLAIVTLDDKTSDISVPSKVYNIMAAAVPIMAIAPLKSGISALILQHKLGFTFQKENIGGMCDFILELQNDPELQKKLSSNSYKASLNYTKSNAAMYLKYYND